MQIKCKIYIKNYVKFDATKHNILGLKMFVVHAEINMFDSHLNLFGCKINSCTIFIKSIHVVKFFSIFYETLCWHYGCVFISSILFSILFLHVLFVRHFENANNCAFLENSISK